MSSSGEMRHRITIYAPEGTSNEYSGSPTEIANGIPAKIAFEIHEECCNERTFHIVSMIQDDKLEWLDLTCQVVA
jgi:hypothetical protein